MTRCILSAVVVAWLAGWTMQVPVAAADKVTKFARVQVGDRVVYGVVEGDKIREIAGDPFGAWKPTECVHSLADVRVLVPTEPSQVIAMAGNYRSHLGEGDREIPEKFRIPQPFFKSPSCVVPAGADIVIPKGTAEVHYEAEMVIVIGRLARDVPKEKALDYVLGVTCGNDVSARDWQSGDVQWWRAKGSDTFGPCGPFVVSGINYDDLLLQLRLNGEVKQKQRTRDFIHGVAAMVSFISQHVTLKPGDLIFTGTPGHTSPIKAGDVVEVELEHVGVLRNPVEAE
jgi:2-keto-4-pentenoate hydratase/2-oxohepta-3-ene-1,7-dioic acid hydratase in catechol pathway